MTAGGSRGPDMHAFVESLVGQTIQTLSGKPNEVLRVDGDRVLVGTRRSPAGAWVRISEIQDAADRLWMDGELDLSKHSVGYRSAFVAAVLERLPETIATLGPRWIRLARTGRETKHRG